MKKVKAKLKINTQIDIEETYLRIKLNQTTDAFFRLQLLINFRPDASLRQINNIRKLNFGE